MCTEQYIQYKYKKPVVRLPHPTKHKTQTTDCHIHCKQVYPPKLFQMSYHVHTGYKERKVCTLCPMKILQNACTKDSSPDSLFPYFKCNGERPPPHFATTAERGSWRVLPHHVRNRSNSNTGQQMIQNSCPTDDPLH